MSIADDFFTAQRAMANAEDDVCALLTKILGAHAWHDFTADHYDGSIELYGVSATLTDEQQQAFWEAGFDRCWTHEGTERRDDKVGEKAYWKTT